MKSALKAIGVQALQTVLAIGGASVVAISIAYFAVSSRPQQESKTTVEPPIASTCQLAGGSIWSGVSLYEDKDCTSTIGSIVGGGRDKVFLAFHDGSSGWKNRRAVAEKAYVLSSDPAIAASKWRSIDP